jgi:hypothetical protein
MSFSAPGPRRDDSLSVTRTQGAPKVPGAPTASRPPLAGDQVVSSGPPALQRLLSHEQSRSAARIAGDKRLADSALRDVVGDLDGLLQSAAAHLQETSGRRSRKQLKKAVPQLVAIDELGYLPLGDVAEFLDLSRTDVAGVLTTLSDNGDVTPADRRAARDQLGRLRAQLQEVEINRDQSQLDRLIGYVVKIALLVGVAVAATPLGALAVGDSVLSEAIKTGVIALVAIALQQGVDITREWQKDHDPYAVAQRMHGALLEELSLARNLSKSPAYAGEHTVIEFRLQLRCATARITSLPLEWEHKQEYWLILDQIALALDHQTPKTLILLHRKLQTIPPPKTHG